MKQPSAEYAAQPTHRLGYLDALRGFAALYVVIYHISHIPRPILEAPSYLKAFVDFGGSGVLLFFVISGFSMRLTWGKHASTEVPFRHFYITRFFRIAPLFYFWLVVSLLRDYAYKGNLGLHSTNEVAANIFFLFNMHEPYQFGIVWASWTIGVEMLFYLFFPIISTYIGTNFSRSTMLLLFSIAIVTFMKIAIGEHRDGEFLFLHTMFSGVGFLYMMPVFLLGVVTFHINEWLHSITPCNLHRSLGYLLGALSISGIILTTIWFPDRFQSVYITAFCYGILLLAFSMSDFKPLVNSQSIYIGKISYSLYLNHPNLVYLLTPFYVTIYSMNYGSSMSFLACIILTLIILIPLSQLTFRFIEKPFTHLGKQLLAPTSLKLINSSSPQKINR